MSLQVFLLGWSGGGLIAGSSVLVTSASVESTHTPSFFSSIALPPMGSTAPFSRYVHAEGTKVSQGSMSFDVSRSGSGVANLLTRGMQFSMSFGDGNSGRGGSLSGCVATSTSFSGSVGGLVTGSCSFVSMEEAVQGGSAVGLGNGEEPIGYWRSGGANVRDWSLSMSCSVTPMYANTTNSKPAYLRVTTVDYTLSVTSYSQTSGDSISIGIGNKTITGFLASKGASFNGASDIGTYSYTFESSSGPGGTGDILIS